MPLPPPQRRARGPALALTAELSEIASSAEGALLALSTVPVLSAACAAAVVHGEHDACRIFRAVAGESGARERLCQSSALRLLLSAGRGGSAVALEAVAALAGDACCHKALHRYGACKALEQAVSCCEGDLELEWASSALLLLQQKCEHKT